MTDLASGDPIADLMALLEQYPEEPAISPAQLAWLEAELSAVSAEPEIVANPPRPDNENAQPTKGERDIGADRDQCADSPPHHPLTQHHQAPTQPITKRRVSRTSHTPTPANENRTPRRNSSRIDVVARKKSWSGSRSKSYRDRLTPVEKFAAAIWAAKAAGGQAVSLNLGVGREASLMAHENPRRRFMQTLNRYLNEEGLAHVPYALNFELTPENEGFRLHIHGVVCSAGLSPADVEGLGRALIKAGARAAGVLGGKRQLELGPISTADGWADYLLKDATRTARDLGIDHPFMLNAPMTRAARSFFDTLHGEVKLSRSRADE